MEDNEMTMVAFNIIANVGDARSNYINAIDLAAQGKYEEAEAKIEAGKASFNEGHSAHQGLLTKFANGELPPMDILMTHAEDQLMSAEAFGILAERFITLYKKVNG